MPARADAASSGVVASATSPATTDRYASSASVTETRPITDRAFTSGDAVCAVTGTGRAIRRLRRRAEGRMVMRGSRSLGVLSLGDATFFANGQASYPLYPL
jgi:hypothetical protein